MRILIVGVGAVGGFFGAHLLNAGRDVTFLVRPARAQQLAMAGLRVVSVVEGVREVHLEKPKMVLASELSDPLHPSAPIDLIVLSCKAYDLQSSVADFAPAAGADTTILPLLNGLAHLEVLDSRFGRQRVLGGHTTVSTSKQADGSILQLAPLDALYFGDRDEPHGARIERVAAALKVPGFEAILSENIVSAMWLKWLTIATAASVTCLLRCAIGDVVAAGQEQLVRDILGEASAVASAAGYPAPPEFLDGITAKFTQPGSLFTTSMFRDICANAPIEGEQIIGNLLTHARRFGVRTSLLNLVHAHLLCYEARRERELRLPAA